MRKELKHELKVAASADDIWEVYSSPDLPTLIVQLLPDVFDSIEVVEGDGGVGTVLHITFPPGSVPLAYKERFVTMDDQKRLKEVKQIEGGYLEMGCTFYMDSFHILEKSHNSCVIVSKTEYEVPNEEIESQVEPYISIDSLANMATAISNYVLEKKKPKLSESSSDDEEDDRSADECSSDDSERSNSVKEHESESSDEEDDRFDDQDSSLHESESFNNDLEKKESESESTCHNEKNDKPDGSESSHGSEGSNGSGSSDED